jgi:ribosomal protein S18 acetylase RimI-like enzyme
MTDTRRIIEDIAHLGLQLRPIVSDDRAFLARVYASTRAAELALTDWSQAQKDAFVAMQFDAQHRHYQDHYTGAAFQVILYGGAPIGRLYFDHWPDELRIVDIALLPEYQRKGLGSGILSATLREGQRLGLPVRIHVELFNPALQLYMRLGFRVIDTHGAYYLLERTPQEQTSHA